MQLPGLSTPLTSSNPRIRVFLLDDNPQFLKVAAEFLATFPHLHIVGTAQSGSQALAQIEHLRPDLALIDLAMPSLNGLEMTRRLKQQPAAPRVILLILHDNSEYRQAAQAAGADGSVVKADLGTQLLPLIQTLFTL